MECSISKPLYRILKIIFYVLNNNFSYTQLFLVCLLQKDSYFDPNDINAFFLCLPERDFYICTEPFFAFFLFLLLRDLRTFPVLLCEVFLCFFCMCIRKNYKFFKIVFNYFYSYRKNYKKTFFIISLK